MPLEKNAVIPLTITSIANDGNGVGRHSADVVFVPHAAVGDKLSVKIVGLKKNISYGRIEEFIVPGPGRVAEDCPASRQCGGCCFRHLSYEAELAAKHGFVADALARIGKLAVDVPPVLPSPSIDRYRNNVRYPVAVDDAGQLHFGFFAPRSHRIVPCADCLLQPDKMNLAARKTAELLQAAGLTAYDEATGKGQVRHICVRQSHETGKMMVCVVAAGSTSPAYFEAATALAKELPAVASVALNLNSAPGNAIYGKKTLPLLGDATLADILSGVPLIIRPTSFSQVNSPGAELLFGLAAEYAGLTGGETLLDLYCGTGVIGLSMAKQCQRLIGVEISPEAVQSAVESAKLMGLVNAEFLLQNAPNAAKSLAGQGIKPDVAVLDPPRKGCEEETLAAVCSMAPRRIVMVSCNPATLARDLSRLAAGGYALQKVQPVDMFPRTRHVECVALLEKTN